MQDGFAAVRGDFEHRPAAASLAAFAAAQHRGAVQIAGGIRDQVAAGICAVGAAGKSVQHLFLSVLVDLEYRSTVVGAAIADAPLGGGAVEIASYSGQRRQRQSSVATAGKRMQNRFGAVGCELVHCPATVSVAAVAAAVVGRAVEIAVSVLYDVAV